jgi:hypothetical protein
MVLFAATVALASAALSSAQGAKPTVKLEDTCSITGQANAVHRIQLVRLANGYYGHRAYDRAGKIICYSEWSATSDLNRQAAETLRAKGNNQAAIVELNQK